MVLRFAEFELDIGARALRRAGQPVPLEPRAFDLLAHLARNPDRVIGRDELLRVVWPSVRVTRASVDQAVRSVRRALGDPARAPRFLRTVARHGLQFAGALEPQPERARKGTFIGRTAELAHLRASLEAVQRGTGGVVLITGPAGIGKTRTASEVLGWARERGLATATTCEPPASASAAAPWRVLAASLGADPRAIDRAAERGALFPALREAFEELCARSPRVVLIDDLHAADTASVEFLAYLSGHPRSPALLAIATSRPASEFGSSEAARVFERVCARAGAAQLALAPFSSDEVSALIAVETGLQPEPARARAFASRLAGNPFWILQLLHAGAADSLTTDGDEPWERVAAKAMRDALRDRLGLLGPMHQEVLQAAAVLGDEIDASLVALTCQVSEQRVCEALATGRAAGLLAGGHGSSTLARFAHPLLREAMLGNVAADRLAALHFAAAHALAALPLAQRAERDVEVAQHLLAAGRRGDPARAVALGLACGTRALRDRAGDRAEALLAQTTELLDAADAPPGVRCAAWVALARARGRTGIAESSGAAEQALAWARIAEAPEAFAEAALAWVGAMDRLRLPDPRFVGVLEEARERLGTAHPAARARVLGRLEAELSYAPDTPARTDLRERALAEARNSGDPSVELGLLEIPFGGFWAGLPSAERMEIIERSLVYASASGRRDLALAARVLHGSELAAQGELARQGEVLDAAAAEARDLGDLGAQYRLMLQAATRCLALGELERSQEVAIEAQARAERVGFPGDMVGRVQRMMVAIARGRARDALVPLELARSLEAGPGVSAMLVHALAAAGEHERCAALLRELAESSLASLSRHPSAVANAHVLACAAAYAGVPEVVPILEPILRPERGRVAIRGLMTSHGPVSLALACCAHLRGAGDETAPLLAEAEQLATRAGAPGWRAEVEALRDRFARAAAAAGGYAPQSEGPHRR